jgi:MFS family permease
MLWVVGLLNYLDRQLIVTMGWPVKTHLNITDADFGLLSSVFLWMYAICSPAAGFIADRFGSRRVIILSLSVWSTATLATGFASSFQWMLAARAMMGISEAFYIPAALALIVQYHRGRTQSTATGLLVSGACAGSALGGLGGWIAESFGWRFGFQLFGTLGIGYALLLVLLLEDPPSETTDPSACREPNTLHFGQTLRALLGSRGLVLLLCVSVCNGASFWTIRNWMPTCLNMELGVSLTRAGIYGAGVLSVAILMGLLIGGVLSDRWAARTVRARTLIPAIGFCLAAPCLFSVGLLATVPVVIGTVIIVGVAGGCLETNMMPAVCLVTAVRHRATAYGLINCVGTLSGGIMTFVGGWLKDAHVPFATTFQLASGFIMLAGLLLLAVRPGKDCVPRKSIRVVYSSHLSSVAAQHPLAAEGDSSHTPHEGCG